MEQNKNLPAVLGMSSAVQNTPVNDKQAQIAGVIFPVNMLQSTQFSDASLEQWAKQIDIIVPGVEISELESIMRSYMIGLYEWDHRKGIQNVLSKIEAVKMEIHKRTMVY